MPRKTTEMITILLAILLSAAIGFALCKFGDSGYNTVNVLSMIAGVVILVATSISSLVYVFAGWQWYAAEHKAKIINREYGTKYTQSEVFYASDVIDTVRQLDRSRVEINGNILKPKP